MTDATPPTRPPAWLIAIATVTGNLYILLGSLVLSVIGVLVSWIPPRGSWTFALMRIWSNALLAASFVRVEVRYDPALEPDKSYVFLCNHQSLFDVPAVVATSPGQVRMMAKRSLFRIPFFGWTLKAGGFIPVDRGESSKGPRTFSSASAQLRAGTSILLFPEGTRAHTDTLLPFKRGGFLLALKSGLPIVPVGIRGSRHLQPRESLAIHPGSISVTFGAPIETAAYGIRRRKELMAEVRRRIAELAGSEMDAESEAAEDGEG